MSWHADCGKPHLPHIYIYISIHIVLVIHNAACLTVYQLTYMRLHPVRHALNMSDAIWVSDQYNTTTLLLLHGGSIVRNIFLFLFIYIYKCMVCTYSGMTPWSSGTVWSRKNPWDGGDGFESHQPPRSRAAAERGSRADAAEQAEAEEAEEGRRRRKKKKKKKI